MVALNQLVSEVIVKDSASAAADRVSAAMDKLSNSESTMQDQTAKSTRSIEAAARSFEKLTAAADPAYATQQRLMNAQVQANKAVDLGVASQEEANATLAKLAAQYDATARAAKAMADAQTAAIASARQQQLAETSQFGVNQTLSSQGVNFSAIGGGSAGDARASAAVFEEAEAAIKSEQQAMAQLDAEAAALIQRYDPLTAAQTKYAAATDSANKLLAAGKISVSQHAAAIDGEKAALEAVSTPYDNLNTRLKLSYTNVEILRSGFINTAQSLAAGMDPLQTFTTQLFQTAPALGEVGTMAGLSTTALVAVGGAATVVIGSLVALGVAYNQGAAQTRAFNQANQLTAGAAGVTRDSLEGIVKAATDAGTIGAGAARSIATEMVATGKLNGQLIQQLTSMTADYAKATGESVDKAGTDLGKLFSDPQQALQQLNQGYNLLSTAERQHIQNLIDQGNRTAAQSELADKLNDRIKNLATDGMGVLGKTWTALGNAAAAAWDKMTGIGRGQTLEQQLAAAQQSLQALQDKSAAEGNPGYLGPKINEAQGNVANLQSQKDAQDLQARLDAQAASLKQLGDQATTASQAYGDFTQKQQDLTNEQIKWQNAVKQFNSAALTAESETQAKAYLDLSAAAQKAADGVTRAKAALKSPVDEAQTALDNARQVAAAPPSQRAALQAGLSARQSALADPSRSADADKLAAIAAQQATIQQTTAIADENRQISLNTQLTLATADAWLKSGSAGQEAAAKQSAALEALQQPIDAQAKAQQLIAQQVAQASLAGAQQVQTLEAQTAAQQRLAAASAEGPASEKAVDLNNQIIDQTRTLTIALDQATNPQQAAQLASEIERIEAALRGSAAAANDNQVNQLLSQQRDQLSLLNAQSDMAGDSKDSQAQQLAHLQAQITLQQQGLTLTQQQRDQYLDNADAIAKENLALDKQKQVASEIPDFLGQAFDQIGQSITQLNVAGQSAMVTIKSLGVSILGEIEQELIKLAIINPLKNALEGGNATTLSDLLNGFFGSGSGGGIGGAGGAGSSLSGVPLGHANGGDVTGNVPIMVGERGQELFVPKSSGVIVPNHVIQAAAANSNTPTAGAGSPQVVFQLIDQRQSGSVDQQQSTGPNGEVMMRAYIRDQVNQGMASGAHDKVMGQAFGLSRKAGAKRN